MTDINGIPIIEPQAVEVLRPATAIAQVAVELGREQNVVEMKLKAPGIVRAAAFWLQTPNVIGVASGGRAVQKIMQPLLFVECDPAGELLERVFAFIPSGTPFVPRDGFKLQYRATALGETGAMHVFEIVEATS